MIHLPLRRLLAAVTLCVTAAVASAQSPVAITAPRDTLSVGDGGTVTLVLGVHTATDDSTSVQPEITLPAGWSAVIGTAPWRLAARQDTWLVGVAAPNGAPAGVYTLRLALRAGAGIARDTALVRIPERRALDIEVGDGPSFVASGGAYQAQFVIRNRGNVPEHVGLDLTSSAKSRGDLSTTAVSLEPGASIPVIARMLTRSTDRRSIMDVIELATTDSIDHHPVARASTHVLIVPRGGAGSTDPATVPAQIALRAASPSAGVAPVVLSGSGPITPGSGTSVDFLFRAPVAQQSFFGERDEYHFGIENDRYAAMLGDGSYSFSKLTSSGFPGFGGSFRMSGDALDGGVYLQHDRWTPYGGTEAGAFVGTETAAPYSGSAVLVGRATGAHIASLTGRAHLGGSSTLEIETAASDSGPVTSAATRAQLTGQVADGAYDVGFLWAAPNFAGPGRGNTAAHASISVQPGGPMAFRLSANTLGTKSLPFEGFNLSQSMTNGAVEADYSNALALIYEVTTRNQDDASNIFATQQEGFRARGLLRWGSYSFHAEAAREEVLYGDGSQRPFESMRVEADADLHHNRSVSVYTQVSQGASLNMLTAGGLETGASAQLELMRGLSLTADGSITASAGFGSSRYGQEALTLTRELPRGALLSLRAHMAQYGNGLSVPGMNAVYLELRTPLHIPTGPSRVPGRVEGRVVDATTGRGMSNLLVRVGNETVITDGSGHVSVAGLEPGHYGLSLESADRASPGVLVGDASVDVLEGERHPAKFSVSLAKGGRITATIRSMEFLGGGPAPAGATVHDSLVDAGGLANAVVAIESGRDTIYQTTDAGGHVDFGDVAPGHWTVRVVSADLAEFHIVETDHFDVDLTSGARRDIQFRVVPKRRTIRIMPTDGAPVIKSDGSATPSAGHETNVSPAPVPAARRSHDSSR